MEEPPPQAVEIHAEQPERLEEPPVEAQRFPWANEAGECIVTYYCVCSVCCGKEDGITASGAAAVPYETCAVDPEVIPLGSTVMLEFDGGETNTYRAEDTGVSGNHVDICVSGHQEALRLGVRTAAVYWEAVEYG